MRWRSACRHWRSPNIWITPCGRSIYFTELMQLVEASDVFEIVAHVDYPLRYWPVDVVGEMHLADFEEELRQTLHVIAGSGRILELNTVLPMDATILGWWRDEGGRALTFGSDAHQPEHVSRLFTQAIQLAAAAGFSPQRDPLQPWCLLRR